MNRREAWLKKRKMTTRQMSDALQLDYNTVVRWFEYGRTPRKLYLQRLLVVYPDFPI